MRIWLLYEYLFSGVPILNIGGQNIASRIIDNTGMGKTFSPSDAKGINEYIQQIKAGVFTAKSMNLKQYTREEQCKKLAKEINEIDKQGARGSGRKN